MHTAMTKQSPRPARRRTRSGTTEEPIPLLLVRREGISRPLVGALLADARFEVFDTSQLRPDCVQLANGAAAVVLATMDDPLRALGYAVTAGVRTPIFVAGKRRFRSLEPDLRAAGAAGFLTLPIRMVELDGLSKELAEEPTLLVIGHTLRLVLDPIARVARYRDQT